jgi:hypothetical protein
MIPSNLQCFRFVQRTRGYKHTCNSHNRLHRY